MTRLGLIVAGLAFAILAARWFEEGDYYDPVRGRRHCRAAPAAVKDWSYTNRERKPTDRANLDRWLEQNPDQVNQLFGPFCHSALHVAARFGREDLTERLIARGADVQSGAEPNSDTPLHLAAQYGSLNAATVLIARGADVNATTRFGRTPLHDAVYGLAGTSDLEGRVAVVKLLLSRGADVNARERGSKFTPLHYALANSVNPANSERMAQVLREAGGRE
jgi:ankyrin repeat protein